MMHEDDIFGEALELPSAERAEFLGRACRGDPELRARVEALLAGYDRAGEFLERPIAGNAIPASEAPGDVIDRYTLVRQLGEGGCGTVYLAEQTMPVRRRVALKIVKIGMDTRQVIARFEGERQALALMDHPDIARVIDAGATESGRPFFVMEFVDGVPVTRYCDERRLSIAARLDLFTRICLALQHAHQKGIIHRDVKPSNVLVAERDGAPAPKIIDFGIAKATQGRLTEQTLLTGVDQLLGTPAYMSPEQADLREGDIDTRSDVYSLGVLLYELLTGRLPFASETLRQTGVDGARRLICATVPPRPSARLASLPAVELASVAELRHATPATLTAALHDDLDWIAMRCLEKDRERRYGSAQELADDVRRHLRHEPVVARPPSALYRSRRFVARHRAACAAAAAAALALVAGTAISVRQAVRATRAERLATAERDAANAASGAATRARADAQRRQEQAEDLLTFMLGNFRTELKNTRVEVLDAIDEKAIAYFASLDQRDLDDTVLARQAKALYQIGETRMDEARYAEAAAAFSASYARAAALVARHPRNGDMLFERAQAEYWIGFVAWRRGDFATAGQWLTRYRDSAVALVALEGDPLRARHELAYGYHNLAVLDVDRARLREARDGFLAERQAVEAMLATSPNDVSLRFSLADVASWLGTVAERDGRFDDALATLADGSSQLQRLVDLQPKVARWRLRLADSIGYTADILALLGRRKEASAAYERAEVLRHALVVQDPKNRQWLQAWLNGRLKQLVFQLADDNASVAATATLADLRDQLEAGVKTEPTSRFFAVTLAKAWQLEARLRFVAHRSDARDAVARALELEEPLVRNTRADDLTLGEFAQSYLLAGRLEEAAGNGNTAREDWEKALAVLTPRLDDTHHWRLLDPAAQALALLGRTDEARPLIERLQRFGYRSLDPLAASTLDAVAPARSNLN